MFADPTGQLHRQRFAEARALLDRDIAERSKLRKVSLTRLEAAIEKRIAEGQHPTTPSMRYLAGLTQIRYVFYYPETKDIVIAGPAEGWGEDLSGRVVALGSKRPVLELQDLVVALRAFPPNGDSVGAILCSIDPTTEGLANMQQFLREYGSRATPADTPAIVDGLRRSLGMQSITIDGVSANTHFAEVMAEADYRMKLIGIGLEEPPVNITSWVARVKPTSVSRNALQRWFFVPDYECVRVSDDGLAMQLIGRGVKLVSESEYVSGDGTRNVSGRTNRASELFVKSFTEMYPELARKAPVFAQLRNLIDMSVAAAFIQEEDYYGQAGWSMELLGDEGAFSVERQNAPRQVATAVNSFWKGRRLLTPIGGGVSIQPRKALDRDNLLTDDEGTVTAARESIDINSLPRDKWWWD